MADDREEEKSLLTGAVSMLLDIASVHLAKMSEKGTRENREPVAFQIHSNPEKPGLSMLVVADLKQLMKEEGATIFLKIRAQKEPYVDVEFRLGSINLQQRIPDPNVN